MILHVSKDAHGKMVMKVSLRVTDLDSGEALELSGEVTESSPIAFLSDASQVRSAAAAIVGRMVTRWRMGLIDSIAAALPAAVEAHLMELHRLGTGGAGQDGTVEEGSATDIAGGADPTP